ncbi:MAG: ATP-binding protein [Novosphingobium sp.]
MTVAGTARRGLSDWLPVGAALLVSVALVWLITREPLVAGAFAGGLVTLGTLAAIVSLRRPAPAPVELAQPDWSVTVAAIERPDSAVAITDRAGRMVCANRSFEQWFGLASPPPRLPIDDASLERLTQATRAAWRDGSGSAEPLTGPTGSWRCTVTRAGRGEDFLVWQLAARGTPDLVGVVTSQIEGLLGRALSEAGFAAAIVDGGGAILGASAGFAQRALGDPEAPVAGRDFFSLLRRDEGEPISWEQDEQRRSALSIFHVPLADPDLLSPSETPATPSLMLIADAGVGIGGIGEPRAAVPHLEALLRQLPLGLAMADRDGRLLFANLAFMRAAAQEGRPAPPYPTDLVVREDKPVLSQSVRRYAQGPLAAGDIAVRLIAQPDETVSLSLAGVRGLGEAAVLLGLTDSTEETRLKRQVAQATKMQAVGQLAGGVAHDFNNVLTAVLGICDLMLMRHTPGDSDYDDIQQLRACANRAASLTRQLLAFSRQQTLRPEVIQLPDVVSEASQLLRRLIGEKIEFTVTHDRDLGPVRADPQQLSQVIINLVVNARDAIHARGDGRGHVTLATRRIIAADVRAQHSEIVPTGEYSALVVSDDGGGIAPRHLGKIFEPFFTTKEQGRGTGLGLSTVYGIVKQSGGFVFADSELGTGTRFTVYLPVHHGAAGGRTLPPETVAPSAWADGGRILLVEDQEPVRLVAERALTRQGYAVTVAHDGEEGLELVRGGGEFDLVVSDVVMPHMDGPAMGLELRKIAPELPILFISGYAEEQLRKDIDLADVHFLAKPFTIQDLSEKVAGVLRRE